MIYPLRSLMKKQWKHCFMIFKIRLTETYLLILKSFNQKVPNRTSSAVASWAEIKFYLLLTRSKVPKEINPIV